MSLDVYCVVTCDLCERGDNSSDFRFASSEPANKGVGLQVSSVEGNFRIERDWYFLDITLQTPLGERMYKASGCTKDGQSVLLWVNGVRIEADTVNGKRGETIKIITDRTAKCPRGTSPRVYSGIRLIIIGRISEI
jgi:hypothetical protein